jgi:hypothetical protein
MNRLLNIDPDQAVLHQVAAHLRLPGPNYYEVLSWLHEELRPESYLEIGVFRGRSLRLAMPPTIAVGIDPTPVVDQHWQTLTHVLPMRSAEFFTTHSLAEFFCSNRFSLAFIDSLHHFEQALDDFFNLEVFARPDSVVAFHDTIPLDERTASRTRSTEFHTGDVWKVIPFLKHFRPDLEIVTVSTGPSGLTLIRGLDGSRKNPGADSQALSFFRGLPFDYYKQHRHEFLSIIPNQKEVVTGWLRRRRHSPAITE